MVMISFSFCLSEKLLLISPLILNDNFAREEILGLKFFTFQYFDYALKKMPSVGHVPWG